MVFHGFHAFLPLCGIAWSANSLIGFRTLQCMSGGLLAPRWQMPSHEAQSCILRDEFATPSDTFITFALRYVKF
jgi:hypothetical protein